VKEQQVDMVCFESYDQINLDESPVIVLKCGHIYTVETLDGVTKLTDFYRRGNDGAWEAVLPTTGQKIVSMPVCPDCRTPIRDVRRYGRVVTSAAVDVAEKKFVIKCGKVLAELRHKMDVLVKFFQSHKDSLQISIPLQELGIAWKKKVPETRDALLKGAVDSFLHEATEFSQCAFQSPARSVYELILSHHAIVTGNAQSKLKGIEAPRPASLFYGGANMLISQGNFLYASYLRSQWNSTSPKGLTKRIFHVLNTAVNCARMAFILYRDSANTEAAALAKFLELELDQEFVELFSSCPAGARPRIPVGFKSAFATLCPSNPRAPDTDFLSALKECRTKLLEHEIPIVRRSPSAVDMLGEPRIEKMEAWLKDGAFYQDFSASEMKLIVKTMNDTDFHSAGHWYKCPNGHLYTIGECGRAMQISLCPECGSTIGGTSHNLLADNTSAYDVESEA
jgi:hypothetical protein